MLTVYNVKISLFAEWQILFVDKLIEGRQIKNDKIKGFLSG